MDPSFTKPKLFLVLKDSFIVLSVKASPFLENRTAAAYNEGPAAVVE